MSFWNEYGSLIVGFLIFLAMFALIFAVCWSAKPDKIVYEFVLGDDVATFEVARCTKHTDTYYVFELLDGSTVTYYPAPGTIVTRTEIRNTKG